MFEALTTIKIHSMADAPGAWQPAAWMLERRYPKDFGRRSGDASGDE